MNDGLTGEALKHAIENRPAEREALIEELLYTRTATMISADPGAGKSTVVTQLILQLTSGQPVFGYFNVPRPRNVYYLQLEGSRDESFERIGFMSGAIDVDYERLFWDTPTLLNCMDNVSVIETIQRINAWERLPDVIVIDPIYMAVSGDLKSGEVSSALVHFSERLKRTFGCSVILVHHTHRAKYSNEGARISEEDPYYGSQWLKAHIDVGYHLRITGEGHSGVELVAKKSRGGEVQKHIVLSYDPGTYTVRVDRERPSDAEVAVIEALERGGRVGQELDFFMLMSEAQLTQASLRRVQKRLTDQGRVEIVRHGQGRRATWRLVQPAVVPQEEVSNTPANL